MKFLIILGHSWVSTDLPEEFPTNHQSNVSEIHSTLLIVLVYETLSGGATISLITTSNIWYYIINPAEWFHNIHNENDWRQSVPLTCMCNVDISRTIPTTLFLKTKYHKISFKFRAITNLSCGPLNPWLIPRLNIQKSNLYRNGFIVKKMIYWSEHTHNRPGWHSKSHLWRRYKVITIRPNHAIFTSYFTLTAHNSYHNTSDIWSRVRSWIGNLRVRA